MYDIIIIGGGPAGLGAAIYALRNGKRVLLIEKETIGGQIASSPRVENYPALSSLSGADLANRLFEQVLALGIEFELDEVVAIEKAESFKVKCKFNDYEAQAVIVATGAEHKKIGLEDEERWVGRGLSYCAVCDGPFYADQEVCLIGDANSALQSALLLANICKKVHLCLLFDRFFAEEVLVEKVLASSNITITKEILLNKLVGEEELEKAVFRNTKTSELVEFKVAAVFVCIGQVPVNEPFANLLTLNQDGYVVADESCLTEVAGLFVAGDCRNKKIRQLTTALADGTSAALAAVNYLNNL